MVDAEPAGSSRHGAAQSVFLCVYGRLISSNDTHEYRFLMRSILRRVPAARDLWQITKCARHLAGGTAYAQAVQVDQP
jgi:hypothetical protein